MKDPSQHKATKTIMVLVTYNCNLRCSYCYEPKTVKGRMTLDRLKRIILTQVESLPPKYDSFELHFMGGEPLLEFALLKECAEWAWAQQFDKELKIIFAPTNGTLLTDEIRDWCYRNRDRFCLGLSFDGDAAMQNVNRSGSSEKVDLGFFSGTWPEQSVKMTVSPTTIGSLCEGVKYLHSKGFRQVVADLAMGEDIGWEASHLKVLSSQLDALSEYYLDEGRDCNMSMLDLDVFDIDNSGTVKHKTCSCGEDLVCIDLDGESYGCHLFSPVALPIEKARASQNFDFNDANNFTNAACLRCALKRLCNKCSGMNYICNGDVRQPVKFGCDSFKIIYLANCRHVLRKAAHDNDVALIERMNKLIKHIS